jgi:hypothetical protein
VSSSRSWTSIALQLVDLPLPLLFLGAEVGLELAQLAPFARGDDRDVRELVGVELHGQRALDVAPDHVGVFDRCGAGRL